MKKYLGMPVLALVAVGAGVLIYAGNKAARKNNVPLLGTGSGVGATLLTGAETHASALALDAALMA